MSIAPPEGNPRAGWLRALIVEDSEDDFALVCRQLRTVDPEALAERVDLPESFAKALARGGWNIVLSDNALPGFSASAALELLRRSGSDIPFIIVSGSIGEELAVQALKAGANDYVMKDRIQRLGSAIERELAEAVGRAERRDQAQQLRAKEAFVSAVLANIGDAVLTFDDQGRITSLNPSAERLLGLRAAEAFGQRSATVFERNLLEAPLPIGEELLARRADGTQLPVEVVVTRMPGAQSGGFVVTLRDTGERRRFEHSLRANDRLATLGTLAAGIAHEVSNPLAFVTGSVEFARDHLEPPRAGKAESHSELIGSLDDALEGTRRIAAIVSELKTFARPDEGQRGAVDLRRVMEFAVAMARTQLRGINVMREYGEVAPVAGNDVQLGQVFLNLFINAAHALDASARVPRELRLRSWQDPLGARVDVADNGGGIPAQVMERLFQPFLTTKGRQGTGLGLSICKGIVDGMGGTITCQTSSEGTRFSLTFPLWREGAR